MGAENFEQFGYGRTSGEAFQNLCDAAEFEHGHDTHNGTISTTSYCGLVIFEPGKKFTAAKLERFAAHVNGRWDGSKQDYVAGIGDKWECRALALPKSYAKGKGRGVQAFLFVGIAAS